MPSNVYARPGGRYGARLTIGGRQVPLGTHGTREAAEAAVNAARGGAVPSVSTVAEWAAVWQQLYPGRRNAESRRHNVQMVAPFVRVHGRKALADVSPLLAQAWAVGSPGSVRYLRLMFAKAVKAGLADRNVFDSVEIDVRAGERVPPTIAELDALVAAARARGGWWLRFADLIVFSAYSGLRLSEVADVQAADVLGAGARVVVRGKRRAGESSPRERVVAVFGPGVEALARQAPQVGLVWRSRQGRPLNKHNVGRPFADVAGEAGFAGTFHALRHFCATWLLDAGASQQDVAIQLGHMDRAGHADTTQVRTRYGHPDVEQALTRLEARARLVSRSTQEEGSDGGCAAGAGA